MTRTVPASPCPDGTLGLVALDKRTHKLTRDQTNLMPQRCKCPRPVMRTTACFHGNHSRLTVGEKFRHLPPLELTTTDFARLPIDPIQLENSLCQIKSKCCTLHTEPSLPLVVIDLSPLWHIDAASPFWPSSPTAGGRRPLHLQYDRGALFRMNPEKTSC